MDKPDQVALYVMVEEANIQVCVYIIKLYFITTARSSFQGFYFKQQLIFQIVL